MGVVPRHPVIQPTNVPNRLDSAALTCRAIVETPQGQRCKVDFDPDTGLFDLAGVLSASRSFPLAFGLIPFTPGEDEIRSTCS